MQDSDFMLNSNSHALYAVDYLKCKTKLIPCNSYSKAKHAVNFDSEYGLNRPFATGKQLHLN